MVSLEYGTASIECVRDEALARARDLYDDGIVTSVLAVGTPEGAPIPSGGGFVSDRAGNVVIARLERPVLQDLAAAGGGVYSELGPESGDGSIWGVGGEAGFAERDDALGERWKDAGPWLVLLLLPLALVGFRRGLFFVAPLVLANGLLLSPEAEAGWWEDLWLRKDQQAWQSLRSDDPHTAAALARDPSLAGEAWYRSGEYANAGEAWGTLDSADAHYNRGNALAWQGDLDGAIAAYDRALEQDPDHLDAMAVGIALQQAGRRYHGTRPPITSAGTAGGGSCQRRARTSRPAQPCAPQDSKARSTPPGSLVTILNGDSRPRR